MKKFSDLDFDVQYTGIARIRIPGVEARMDFDNGYGVIVIKDSVGGSRGMPLYEMSVTMDGIKCFNASVFINGVKTNLTHNQVNKYMEKVQELPGINLRTKMRIAINSQTGSQ